jgi:hypothetical protein
MQRNMDLVREILLRAEGSDYHTLKSADFPEHDEVTVARHFELMQDAGLVEANLLNLLEAGGVVRGTVVRLTWDGHEFLDSARNDEIWSRTKNIVRDKGGSVSFEVLKSILTKVAMSFFGLG